MRRWELPAAGGWTRVGVRLGEGEGLLEMGCLRAPDARLLMLGARVMVEAKEGS